MRNVKIALIVGSIIALLNHGDSIISGAITTIIVGKILITYFIPFSVASWATIQTIKNNDQ